MNYLFVVAHPDDEVLGAGATICELDDYGHNVFVCCLSSECDTRYDDMVSAMKLTHSILGVKKAYVGRHTALALKHANHLELVQFVEDAIMDCEADVVVTHHPNDSNYDHFVTAEICFEAARLPQRKLKYEHRIRSVLTMEVQSETDWQMNLSSSKFVPNTYMEVTEESLAKKCLALQEYDNVMRDAPHPRCKRNIMALAAVRGSESGYMNAEAFYSMFKLGV